MTTTFAEAQVEIDSKIVAGLKGSIYAGKLNQVLSALLDACRDALDDKAPLVSPSFQEVPTAPTAAPGTNTTQIATTAFVAAGLAGKQPLDATLTALAAVTTAANKLIYATGTDTFATADLTAKGRDVLAVADAAALTALINNVTLGAAGLVPAPGAASGKFLRDDLSWAEAPGAGGGGTGDVTGPGASSDGELVLFNSTTGKAIKRSSSLSGLIKLASGVVSTAVAGTDYGDVSGPAASSNGELVLFNGTTGKAIKRSSSLSGLLKLASGVASAAVAGTDYAPPTSGTGVLKGNGVGGTSTAVAGTDYAAAAHSHAASDITSGILAAARVGSGTPSGGTFLRGDSVWAAIPTGVTSVVVTDTSGIENTHAITRLAATLSGGTLTITITGRSPMDPGGSSGG